MTLSMKPNIVIVVWDAVRAKNLPFFGYARNTTPHLQKMAQDLAIYKNAISSSYWTLPSMASLFTGMYPSSHGLIVEGDTLNSQIMTLAELLRLEGYHCASFNRNPYISAFTGLDRGFHYEADSKCLWDYLKRIEKRLQRKFSTDPSFMPLGNAEMTPAGAEGPAVRLLKHLPDIFTDSGSRVLLKKFHQWLTQLESKPFFAFFQAIEAHSPYRAPLRFGRKFLSLPDMARKVFINQNHLAYALGQSKLNPKQIRILRDAYDNAIRYCDFITHQVCEALKAKKLYENTLIIIMSDHGENIGEHNLMFHNWSLYDNLIKVPLLVKYPKDVSITGPEEKIVQNVDIFPTICSLVEPAAQLRINQFQGNTMFADSDMNREADIAVSELIKPFGPDKIAHRQQLKAYDRRLVSLRTIDKKFLYSSKGDHEFYDLCNDPEESDNLYGRMPQYAGLDGRALHYFKKMDEFYQRHKARIEGNEPFKIEDDDIKEKLKHLGYL